MKTSIITVVIILFAASVCYYFGSSYYIISIKPMGIGDCSYQIAVDTTTHREGDIVWFARMMIDSTKVWGKPELASAAAATSENDSESKLLPKGATKLYERGMIMRVSKKFRLFK